MHSTMHHEMARATAADRVRPTSRAVLPRRRVHPPPIRGRAAYIAARLAGKLDTEQARRALA